MRASWCGGSHDDPILVMTEGLTYRPNARLAALRRASKASIPFGCVVRKRNMRDKARCVRNYVRINS